MKSRVLLLLITLTLTTSCVSVKIAGTGSTARKQSTQYSFQSPFTPFKNLGTTSADHSWISNKTANTISVFTSCSEKEPPLRNIRANALLGIESIDIKSESNVTISDREGLKSLIRGQSEGVPVLIEMIIFKKNSCSYQLSYIALEKNFEIEKQYFNTFIKNFKVN